MLASPHATILTGQYEMNNTQALFYCLQIGKSSKLKTDALGKIVAVVPAVSAALCSLSHQVRVGTSSFPGDGQVMLPVVFMCGELWKSLA